MHLSPSSALFLRHVCVAVIVYTALARRYLQGIKYSGERVGVALDPLPDGPFFKGVAKGGFGADKSSAATLMDKKK